MLYKHSKKGNSLDEKIFKNPPSEYRGAPFWAWNCTLEKDELLRQIGILKEMGFGGFHMHTRSGMNSPYLSEEFMELVKACEKKAEQEGMYAYLYDEDRWPSGSAGGMVTKNPENRAKFISLTKKEKEDAVDKEEGIKTGKPYLIGCYDVVLSPEGYLTEYRKIEPTAAAEGAKWYAYVCTPKESGWYNNQTYIDILSEKAAEDFIKITYDAYDRAVGEHFDKTVPSMFTDEPQYTFVFTDGTAKSENDLTLAWTTDFDDTFCAAYGYSLIDFIPEVRWDKKGGAATVRYHYFNHLADRFAGGFVKSCGDWCSRHGISFTGHLDNEPTLHSQTEGIGDAMRSYKHFQIPGIDMLCNWLEISTAKQAQSAVHQYGREGMLSELYGVTGWAFDFRGHKYHGDWQAALGVTLRVPHLSWVSMKGSAKRDYPASISYQSPWYKEYSYIEDHFARLAAVLTRGAARVNVGVIHPIESYYMIYGADDLFALKKNDAQKQFDEIISRLLFGQIDFDFLCEAILPELCKSAEDGLSVGEMNYSAVVVPELITIRKTTLNILTDFSRRGGKLIFIGDCPKAVDGRYSSEAEALYNSSLHVSSASPELLELLRDERTISLSLDDGQPASDYIYTQRTEGEDTYFFIANAKYDTNPDVVEKHTMRIELCGEFSPVILNTLTGDTESCIFSYENGNTVILKDVYQSDSILIRAKSGKGECKAAKKNEGIIKKEIKFLKPVSYNREEDNVLLLDIAEWSEDGVTYNEAEEVLRIDVAVRAKHNLPFADGQDIQPWAMEPEKPSIFPRLRFTFESDCEIPVKLGFEEAEEIIFNGEKLKISADGYYVDKSIHTIKLGLTKKGKNELIVKVPVSNRLSIEAFYLLGDFDVSVSGCACRISLPSDKIGFGSITNQGMPFYGGNILYKAEFETDTDGMAEIEICHYRGALLEVSIDGGEYKRLAFAPYTVSFDNVSAGRHTLNIRFFGNRNNTFGSLHMCDAHEDWLGPDAWYKKGSRWSYEHMLLKTGVLSTPVIKIK